MSIPPAPARRGFDVVALLKFVRFPLVFTAIADSAAGYFYWAGAEAGTRSPLGLLLLAGASSGLYFFGMGLNDYRDRGKDAVSAPGKVLVSGRLSLGIARAVLVLSLVAGLVCILLLPGPPEGRALRAAAWGQVVACIVVYDCVWKSPFMMGLVRSSNFGMGIMAASAGEVLAGRHVELFRNCGGPMLLLAGYGTALTWASTLEDAERVEPRKVWTAGGFMSGALLFAAMLGISSVVQIAAGLSVAAPGIAWILSRVRKAGDKRTLMLLIRDGVAGFIVLDACLIVGRNPSAGIGILSLLIPASLSLMIFKRRA
jgi:4-hydroxybenzoate polyprenyltransferase